MGRGSKHGVRRAVAFCAGALLFLGGIAAEPTRSEEETRKKEGVLPKPRAPKKPVKLPATEGAEANRLPLSAPTVA